MTHYYIIMEPKFVLILDNSTGALSIIELTKEELRESESYEDFESFLTTIENKYGFRLTYSSWMTTENLTSIDIKTERRLKIKM